MNDLIKENYNIFKSNKIAELKGALYNIDEENIIAISEGHASLDEKLKKWSLYNIQSMIDFCNGIQN